METIIECQRLTKRYAEVTAVDRVNLRITRGEIFGLVGPNGAGKTTLIEMIEGLRAPDSGSITVHGFNPADQAKQLQEVIGVQLQTTSIQPNLKVVEALHLFASLYQNPLPNPEVLIEQLSLGDKAHTAFKKLSGGQQQRVAIALALVNDPEIVFFDELSTGLDPQARRKMWELIKDINQQGVTIFLTTHYMEEPQQLCDRVGIIDHGSLIALDTPDNLIHKQGSESKVLFKIENGTTPQAEFESLAAVNYVEQTEGEYVLFSSDSDDALIDLIRLADNKGYRLSNIRIEVSNLDDVFLTLTGKEYRE